MGFEGNILPHRSKIDIIQQIAIDSIIYGG